jgi:hypothetical protein
MLKGVNYILKFKNNILYILNNQKCRQIPLQGNSIIIQKENT